MATKRWKQTNPKFEHVIALGKETFERIPAAECIWLAVDSEGQWWISERIPDGPDPQLIPVELFWRGERGYVIDMGDAS
jgi:hypothetical protein